MQTATQLAAAHAQLSATPHVTNQLHDIHVLDHSTTQFLKKHGITTDEQLRIAYACINHGLNWGLVLGVQPLTQALLIQSAAITNP